MLRKIRLYGELAKFLGQKTFEAEVHSAAQAIRFLVVNFPQLEAHMGDRYYKVLVGDWEIKEEEIHYPNGQEDIKIVPIVGGEGVEVLRQFLLGVALIGTAILFLVRLQYLVVHFTGARICSAVLQLLEMLVLLQLFRTCSNVNSCSKYKRTGTRSQIII